METIPLDDVNAIRERITRARAVAAERFREAFAESDLPPNERWRSHLEIQAAALVEAADGVQLRGRRIVYDIDRTTIAPYVERGKPLFPYFVVNRTPAAVLEYWIVVSEILSSPAWSMTTLVATSSEYDEALRRMQQPQIVRALVPLLLPAAEWRADDSAMLEVTVYTRAVEERIERRLLVLDQENEFSFHSRTLLAEGRGGVGV